MEEKQAVLIAGFGTTHPDTLEKAILPVEQAIRRAAGDIPCFRAFTSPTVRRILGQEYGMQVDSVAQAMEKLSRAGFTRVRVQPTLLLPGQEYDRLRTEALSAAGLLEVALGKPLLWDDQDFAALAEALLQSYPLPEDTLLLMMGHGTSHPSSSLYPRLRRHLVRRGMELCTMEGQLDFDFAVHTLLAGRRRKVQLAPLLLAAGKHAKTDMALGLKTALGQAGFQVSCSFTGLGELPAVQELFARRLEECL